MTPRERLAKVLADWGIDALTSDPPHSWRCAYYKDIDPAKGGGPCDHVSQLLDDLEAASTPEIPRAFGDAPRLPMDPDPDAVEVSPGTWLHWGMYLRGTAVPPPFDPDLLGNLSEGMK